jgi:hypothetical protein
LGIYLVWKGFKTTRPVDVEASAPAVQPTMAAV